MKVRIQTVDQLKQAASKQLQEEFSQRYQTATLEGAMQGMAFVMYALETQQGWKQQRQQKLFQDMLKVMAIPEQMPWLNSFNALDIRKHIETEFGIDFRQILQKVDALPPED